MSEWNQAKVGAMEARMRDSAKREGSGSHWRQLTNPTHLTDTEWYELTQTSREALSRTVHAASKLSDEERDRVAEQMIAEYMEIMR